MIGASTTKTPATTNTGPVEEGLNVTQQDGAKPKAKATGKLQAQLLYRSVQDVADTEAAIYNLNFIIKNLTYAAHSQKIQEVISTFTKDLAYFKNASKQQIAWQFLNTDYQYDNFFHLEKAIGVVYKGQKGSPYDSDIFSNIAKDILKYLNEIRDSELKEQATPQLTDLATLFEQAAKHI